MRCDNGRMNRATADRAVRYPTDSAPAAQQLVVGIGWRHRHYARVLNELPPLAFLEVHSENFFAAGGAALATLLQARQHYPISLHGVGLGLGSAAGVDTWHIRQLKQLVDAVEPIRVSDHACFGRGSVSSQTVHAADLLPIPFNAAAQQILVRNTQQVQQELGRQLLIENLSAYVTYGSDSMSEPEFLNGVCQHAGCALLLDVNNIYVNALNARLHDENVDVMTQCRQYLDAIDPQIVGEIHLAGHCAMSDIIIDDHGSRVREPVWALYTYALRRFGRVPTLIEWDTDIPALEVLLTEAQRAEQLAQSVLTRHETGAAI